MRLRNFFRTNYVVCRGLNWQIYRNKFTLLLDQVFGRCGVVVRGPFEDTPEFQARIRRLGFDAGSTLHAWPHAIPVEFQKPRYGGMDYGPYRVYCRFPITGKAG